MNCVPARAAHPAARVRLASASRASPLCNRVRLPRAGWRGSAHVSHKFSSPPHKPNAALTIGSVSRSCKNSPFITSRSSVDFLAAD